MFRGVAQAEFQRVEVGVSNGGLIRVAAEIRSEWAASIAGGFVKRAASGSTQTQRRITGIRFDKDEQAMRLIAHIGGAEQGVFAELSFDGERVLLGIRNAIGDRVGGN